MFSSRYSFLGTAVYGPLFHGWYGWLDSRLAGTAAATVAKKCLIDQFVLGPPSLALFYLAMSGMEGRDDPTEECRKKFLPTFALDTIFWIPVQVLMRIC